MICQLIKLGVVHKGHIDLQATPLQSTYIMPRKKRTREESGLSALEDEYSTYTDDELRKTLIETGQNPGPIDASNRLHTCAL